MQINQTKKEKKKKKKREKKNTNQGSQRHLSHTLLHLQKKGRGKKGKEKKKKKFADLQRRLHLTLFCKKGLYTLVGMSFNIFFLKTFYAGWVKEGRRRRGEKNVYECFRKKKKKGSIVLKINFRDRMKKEK